MVIRVTIIIFLILVFGFGLRLYLLGKQSQEMSGLSIGVTEEDNRLHPCADKPNCVVSFYPDDKEHYEEPIVNSNITIDRLKTLIAQSELNWSLKKENNTYLYYTHTSSTFGFVDDIEILITDNKINFRSASRVGYSDLGANKKRINKLRKVLSKNE